MGSRKYERKNKGILYKRLLLILTLLSIGFSILAAVPANGGNTKGYLMEQKAPNARLINPSVDLEYLGAFRVPKGDLSNNTMSYARLGYGGAALTYNPIRNSLLIVGHPYGQKLVEISIPEVVKSRNISDLKTASLLQTPVDITDGNLDKLSKNGTHVDYATLGDFLIYNNTLFGAAYSWYDGGYQGYRSHFYASLNWSTDGTNFHGMYMVGDNPEGSGPNGGFVGGYMTLIPSNWRGKLGGPVITGLGGVSIISRSSFGPDAWVFNPEDLIGNDYNTTVNATMLLGYPSSHTSIGCFYNHCGSVYFDMSTKVRGVVFPNGTDTVLFFGSTGLSESGLGNHCCYGEGTSNHTEVSENGKCWDPVSHSKGTHGYPYTYHVWAYNAYDLLKVKNREINPATGELYKPWDIKPYAISDLYFPFASENAKIMGVAYDPQTQRIFISEYGGEIWGVEPYPIIQVYKVHISSFTMPQESHGQIRINNNTELANMAISEGWPGNGSSGNPYMISGYTIDANSTGPGIFVGNTTLHIIIRDMYIYNASWKANKYFYGAGILLYNVTNASIVKNTLTGYNDFGILLEHSKNVSVAGNNITDCYYGIYLGNFSDENSIIGNYIGQSGRDGLFLYSSSNNTIQNNIIEHSNVDGISLFTSYNESKHQDSDNNIISGNTINFNGRYGVYIIYFSSHNLIYNNTFMYNHFTDDGFYSPYLQAYDDGSNNSWNTSSKGNYWYDWANNNDSNDQNHDGIVDWPYQIAGRADAKDYIPLKETSNPAPEISPLSALTILLIVAIIALIVHIKR